MEQQRSQNRMTRSFIGSSGSPVKNARQPLSGRSQMSRSLYTPARSTTVAAPFAGSNRLISTAKAKWSQIIRVLEAEIQRRRTAARLEHDLQIWVRERECIGRRLQRLQRRRTRWEEADAITAADDADEVSKGLAEFDEQVRRLRWWFIGVVISLIFCIRFIILFLFRHPRYEI